MARTPALQATSTTPGLPFDRERTSGISSRNSPDLTIPKLSDFQAQILCIGVPHAPPTPPATDSTRHAFSSNPLPPHNRTNRSCVQRRSPVTLQPRRSGSKASRPEKSAPGPVPPESPRTCSDTARRPRGATSQLFQPDDPRRNQRSRLSRSATHFCPPA
jgi:hypothetical protein